MPTGANLGLTCSCERREDHRGSRGAGGPTGGKGGKKPPPVSVCDCESRWAANDDTAVWTINNAANYNDTGAKESSS